MNDLLRPEPFSEFFEIWSFYVLSWGLVLSLFVFIAGTVGLTIVSAITRRLSLLRGRLARFGEFLLILLPIGGLSNALWCCLVSGNLYYAQDVDSPEDDFSPFFPITPSWLNTQHGHALVPIWHLQLAWLGLAAPAWVMSYLIYKVLRRHRPWKTRISLVHA